MDTLLWDPVSSSPHREDFERFDIVIHLAGENITSQRWKPAFLQRLVESRSRDTQRLVEIFAGLKFPPRLFICASAVGFYGDRPGEILDEKSSRGEGFLSDLCAEWEREALKAKQLGIRVVCTRFGAVLDRGGGILRKVLPAFQWGLGAVLGSGSQQMSWIALDDVARAIEHCIVHEKLSGAVNVVSPNPVSQAQFAALLAKQLHRPLFLRAPAWLMRLIAGRMADELLLSSQSAIPRKLLETGFVFHYPQLSSLLSVL